MRRALALTLLLACEPDQLSTTRCDGECYRGPPETEGVGICKAGPTVCERGVVLGCEDVTPGEEVCDGLDNDCNGAIDDVPLAGTECPTATCNGIWRCQGLELVCAIELPLSDEVCDGRDNDCDGHIDNDLPSVVCYDGPIADLSYGECRAGRTACVEGKTVCGAPQVLAVPEICDNGRDDDCDGATDEGDARAPALDLVFHIDISSSMDDEFQIILEAMIGLAQSLEPTDARIAIVIVPDYGSDRPAVVTDFVKPSIAVDELFAVRISHTVAEEPIYDAICMAIDNLTWRPNTRGVHVFFGDEDGQSNYGRNALQMARRLANAQQQFFGFVDLAQYKSDYEVMAVKTRGALFDLSTTLAELPRIFVEHIVPKKCGD